VDHFSGSGQQGYTWPTVCGGLGTCRTCFVEVQHGHDHLTPIADLEAEGLAALSVAATGGVRLACQIGLNGPVEVKKRAVRRRRPALAQEKGFDEH
jgi:chlorosome envelope protein X